MTAARLTQKHKAALERGSQALNAAGLPVPPDVAQLVAELPAHCMHAADVGVDLSGLRLNVLRIICTLSTPQLYMQVSRTAPETSSSPAHGLMLLRVPLPRPCRSSLRTS